MKNKSINADDWVSYNMVYGNFSRVNFKYNYSYSLFSYNVPITKFHTDCSKHHKRSRVSRGSVCAIFPYFCDLFGHSEQHLKWKWYVMAKDTWPRK